MPDLRRNSKQHVSHVITSHDTIFYFEITLQDFSKKKTPKTDQKGVAALFIEKKKKKEKKKEAQPSFHSEFHPGCHIPGQSGLTRSRIKIR